MELKELDLSSDITNVIDINILQNPAIVYLIQQGNDRSRRVQRQALEVVAEILTGQPDILTCNWAALRFQHTQVIRAALAQRYAPATANRTLTALRGTLKAAWRLKLISYEDYGNAIDIKPVVGKKLTPATGRMLNKNELKALMDVSLSDSGPSEIRDAAIISLAYSCGLRRTEIVTLDLQDYEPETGKLVIQGKRNKERTAYLVNGGAQAMADWLAIRGDDPGALFWPINKAGVLSSRRMTSQAIYNLLSKRGEQAGVRKFSPQDLRRTCISNLLNSGVDINTVAKIAGHSDVKMTASYDRRLEKAKLEAAKLLTLS